MNVFSLNNIGLKNPPTSGRSPDLGGIANLAINPIGSLTSLLNPNGFDELTSKLGLGSLLGHTSSSASNSITQQRINDLKTKAKQQTKNDEDYANTVLHGLGWLLAMHQKNYSGSSPRMKIVNQSDIDLLMSEINNFINSIESVYQLEKSSQSFNFDTSLPIIGLNTNQNKGNLIQVKLSEKRKNSLSVKTSANNTDTNVKTSSKPMNPIIKWGLILFAPFGLLIYGAIKLIKK
ncbi:hypothetical protein [Polaribacter sp. Hel_I_88]|uniref:hypothetical protein n=1 Tax=Polaribacter sp. Hel_I_88 TaxID=1250006 RepID=UPI00047A3E25|nr:hypothetical protein [Polaribacter sp. Hel_I_88]